MIDKVVIIQYLMWIVFAILLALLLNAGETPGEQGHDDDYW